MSDRTFGVDDLFDPRSIAVIGASNDSGKWGYQYARSLLKGRARREVFLVNRNGSEILGERSYRSCADLPNPPVVSVICVPAKQVEMSIAEAVAAGTRYIVCVTAGFAETGEVGAAQQQRIVQIVRRGGARLVGPNCLGLYDAAAELECVGFWAVNPGAVGLVSASGTVVLDLSARLADVGLGLSRTVSIGNQADIAAPEFIRTYAGSKQTRVLIAYIEEFKHGRALFLALESLQAAGTPCVLLAPAASDAARRAASSHTASMLASDEVLESACNDAGIVRVRSIAAAINAVRGLLAPSRAPGRRVAVIADGGGSAVLGTDACVAAGLDVPAFSETLRAALVARMNPGSGSGNPLDTVGALCLEDMRPAIERVLESPEVDGLLLTGALNNVDRVTPEADVESARSVAATAVHAGKGLVVASMYPNERAVQELARLGVPLYSSAVDAASALMLGARRQPRRAIPEEGDVGAPQSTPTYSYFRARELFQSFGVPFLEGREVVDIDGAIGAARAIGYPVVLKALGLLHKSDAGGVALGIEDSAALTARFEDMSARLAPPSFSIEAMAQGAGLELIVGAARQPGFGPTLVVGAGGLLTEVLMDTVTALAPVSPDYAADMLRRLNIARLFHGYRNKPPIDIAAVADLAARFSQVLVAHPEIAEAEINPVLAFERGAVALDARIIPGASSYRA